MATLQPLSSTGSGAAPLRSLTDQARGTPTLKPLSGSGPGGSNAPEIKDNTGNVVPASPSFTSLTARTQAQGAGFGPTNPPYVAPLGGTPASSAPIVEEPRASGTALGQTAVLGGAKKSAQGIVKAAGAVYNVGSGLLLPGSTVAERHNLTFLWNVAKAIPGASYDSGKQLITHPFRSAEDFVGGLARGIANTATDAMVNLVPLKDRAATRAQVQATLDKYLSTPDQMANGGQPGSTPGENLAGGAEIGGSAAPAIAAGIAGGGLAGAGAEAAGLTGLAAKTAEIAGEGAGFVGVGQASLPSERLQPGDRLNQALNDVLGLGIFKVAGLSYNKAKGIVDKVVAHAPKVLSRATAAYEELPADLRASGEIPHPQVLKPLTPEKQGYTAPKAPETATEPIPAESMQEGANLGKTGASEAPSPATKPTKSSPAAVTETGPKLEKGEQIFHIYKTADRYEGKTHEAGYRQVAGKPVKIGIDTPYDFFIHRPVSVRGEGVVPQDAGWIVSEASTGASVGTASTRKGAIDDARAQIEKAGPEKLKGAIEHLVGRNGLPPRLQEAPPLEASPNSIKAPTSAYKDMTLYRGGGKGSMPKGTAEDVVNYERNDLGNTIKAEPGVDLSKVKTDRLEWLTTTKKSAAEYGDVEQSNGTYRIIARDSQDGVLVERAPREEKAPTKRTSGTLAFSAEDLKDPTSESAGKKIAEITKKQDLIDYLSKELDVPIKRGKFRQKAHGIYKGGRRGKVESPQVVRIKTGGLATVFHEVFHHIDERFDWSKEIPKDEITPLLEEYGAGDGLEGEDAKKRSAEAFAEFGRFFLTGRSKGGTPIDVKEIAPEFTETFGKLLEEEPDIRDILDQARASYQRWLEQPAAARVLSQISVGNKEKGPLLERLAATAHDLYTMALDDLHPLSEFSKIARESDPALGAGADPYILARNLRGWVGRADSFLRDGTFGAKFYKTENGKTVPNFTGKSFSDIVKPFEEAGKLDDLRAYLVARRSVELAGRDIKTGIAAGDAKVAVTELETAHPELKAAAEELYKYNDSLLNYVKESGLINKKQLAQIAELNRNYVPFFRVMEETGARGGFMGKKLGSNRNPVKRIKGSEREIVDPLESIVKNTYALLSAADRNSVAVAMARLAKTDYRLGRLMEHVPPNMQATKVSVDEVLREALGAQYGLMKAASPEFADIGETIVNIFRPSFATKPGEISVMMDGKFQTFETQPDLYKAIQALNLEDVGIIMKVLSLPASTLRAGATLTPDFALRNPLRDQIDAYAYSKYGYVPYVDLARGMFELFNQGDVYKLWKLAGGESATLVSIDRPGAQKNLRELLLSKRGEIMQYVKNPINILRALSNTFEVASRLGEMKKGLEQTGDPVAAAYASREITLDFNRIGAKTRALNLITAFWNASVQGTDKAIRELKESPTKVLPKILMGITLPSVLLYLVNRQDKDYFEIPAWERNLFWVIKVHTGELTTQEKVNPAYFGTTSGVWLRYPKPFELGTIFGTVPENILEYLDTKRPGIFDEMMSSIATGAAPGFLPTGAIPLVENYTNYSFFLDRPIVPRGAQALPAQYQVANSTSETSKVIGETFGYSPAKIDNVIHGYTGGLGVYATQLIDSFLVNTGIRNVPVAPASTGADIVGIKAFLVRNPIGSGSESVNRLYNAYDKANAGLTYIKQQTKDGNTDEAVAYLKAHPEVEDAPQLAALVNVFSGLNTARDTVVNSRVLNAKEKRSRIDKIDATMTELAEKEMVILDRKANLPATQ